MIAVAPVRQRYDLGPARDAAEPGVFVCSTHAQTPVSRRGSGPWSWVPFPLPALAGSRLASRGADSPPGWAITSGSCFTGLQISRIQRGLTGSGPRPTSVGHCRAAVPPATGRRASRLTGIGVVPRSDGVVRATRSRRVSFHFSLGGAKVAPPVVLPLFAGRRQRRSARRLFVLGTSSRLS